MHVRLWIPFLICGSVCLSVIKICFKWEKGVNALNINWKKNTFSSSKASNFPPFPYLFIFTRCPRIGKTNASRAAISKSPTPYFTADFICLLFMYFILMFLGLQREREDGNLGDKRYLDWKKVLGNIMCGVPFIRLFKCISSLHLQRQEFIFFFKNYFCFRFMRCFCT